MVEVVIFGAGGAVGSALRQSLEKNARGYLAWDRKKFPLKDSQGIIRQIENIKPKLIFNLAIASEQSGGVDASQKINVNFPIALAEHSARLGYKLIRTSSVMVFPETQAGPY